MQIAIIFIVVIALYIFTSTSKSKSKKKKPSTDGVIKVEHKKHTHLATENEQKLYFALQQAISSEYVIHCQVSLMSLISPVDYKHNSKTWAKRMDYVITDKATKVLAVIELDDSTHQRKKRQERDQYVNESLEGHHKLVRFNTEKYYDPIKVAKKLKEETDINCNEF